MASSRSLINALAIFAKLLESKSGTMSQALARYVLTLGFDAADQEKMASLAEKNRSGSISRQEKDELLSYVKAGDLLGIFQSKARQSLKKKKVS